MSRAAYYDEDTQPYYELSCDGCRKRYRCGDDSCYDWQLLREAAEYDGWNAATPSPTGPHHCPTCVRTGSPATDAATAQPIPKQPSPPRRGISESDGSANRVATHSVATIWSTQR